jgi:hypothetical protein
LTTKKSGGLFKNLRLKLAFGTPSIHAHDTFVKICYQLVRAEEVEVGHEHNEAMFEKHEPEIMINLPERKKFAGSLEVLGFSSHSIGGMAFMPKCL